jgi:hypothetical protein
MRTNKSKRNISLVKFSFKCELQSNMLVIEGRRAMDGGGGGNGGKGGGDLICSSTTTKKIRA